MPSTPFAALDPARPVVDQLRERVAAMQRGTARESVPTLPAIADILPLRAGAAYAVDTASLALALAAGASRAGEWVGFVGCTDFGAEAAAELGFGLSRTVIVPDPAEHWLEVTAALVDVLRVVVLRPPVVVSGHTAGILDSRLRTRSSVLVVHGQWPRVEAQLRIEHAEWRGLGAGTGRLEERRTRVVVHRGARPPRRADLSWPEVRLVDRPVHELLEASG